MSFPSSAVEAVSAEDSIQGPVEALRARFGLELERPRFEHSGLEHPRAFLDSLSVEAGRRTYAGAFPSPGLPRNEDGGV